MPLINKSVRGLLAYAGLYNYGQLPLDYAQTVVPVTEIDHFLVPPEVITTGPTTGISSGYTKTIGTFVPNGERWKLIAAGWGTDNTPQALTRQINVSIFVVWPDGFHKLAVGPPATSLPGGIFSSGGYTFPDHMFLPSASSIILAFPFVGGSGAIPTFYGSAVIERYPA